MTDRDGLVAELTWSEVSVARVGGTEPVLRFEELLDAFPDARLNIEPKHDAAVVPLIEVLRSARALDRVCVGSFSDRRLAEVRRGLGPDACTSLGQVEVAGLRAAAWGLPGFADRLRQRPGLCVQIPVRGHGIPLADASLIKTAHDLGLPVHVWTVNDAADMHRLLDLDVDGLMSDRPGLLRGVLEQRGVWPAPTTG